jgi:hexosaminidase
VDKPGKETRPSLYCLGNEKTYAFLEEVLAQVLDLFPSKYIHVGGDGMQKDRWRICPVCQARKRSEGLQSEEELEGYFLRRIGRILKSHDRRLIGWVEILEGSPRVSEVAVMSWHDLSAGRAAAIAGYDVVMTPKNCTYFDHPQTSDVTSDPDSNGRPFTTLRDVLNFEPIPEGLSSSEEGRILGGEGEMWTDRHPRESSIDRLVYPRAIALIEVLWTHPKIRDYPAFTRRLPAEFSRLDLLGVKYRL